MVGKPGIIDFLQTGLQATSMRQRVIANNVANLNTPGYRARSVRFEELLAEQLESPETLDLEDAAPEMFEPQNTPLNGMGNDVDLEREMGELIKSAGRHKAYLRMLSTQYKQIEQAMRVQ